MIAATAGDLAAGGFRGVQEGIFLLDGSNGVCETMVCLGCTVGIVMHASAWAYRLPPPDGLTAHATEPATAHTAHVPIAGSSKTSDVTTPSDVTKPSDVSLEQAMYSPQFYMLLIGCTGVTMTGLPLILTSKFIINDIFGPSLGDSTVAIAAGFPAVLSTGNLMGRLMWGTLSDRIGCASTLALFGISVPALLMAPLATTMVATSPDDAINLFRGGTMAAAMCYGGAPVLLAPAVRSIFGAQNTTEIYSRMWIAIPLANMLGTTLLSKARDYSCVERGGSRPLDRPPK